MPRPGRWLLLFLVAALACGPQASEGPTALRIPPPPVANPTREHAGTTLVYYGESGSLGLAMDQALAAQFTRDTGIVVNHVPKPQSASDTYSAYLRFFQAESPDLDCMMLDVIWPGAFAPHLADLTPWFEEEQDRYLPQIIQNNTVDGRLLGIPEYLDMGLLYYRTDLLREYGFSGPPRTWQELERMARAIQAGERRKNPGFWGFAWQGYTYEGLTCNALEWQVSSGAGPIIDPQTLEPKVDEPRALESFVRARQWIGTISPEGVTSYQEEEGRNLFQAGNCAFLRSWPYVWALANGGDSKVAGRIGVTYVPRDEREGGRHAATLGGWQLSVSRYSRHPEAAAELVRYWTSPDVLAWRAQLGSYLPTMPEVYDRPEVANAQGLYRVIPEVLPHVVARPSTETRDLYNEVSIAYQQGVAEILQGYDPQEAGRQMQRDLQSALDFVRGNP